LGRFSFRLTVLLLCGLFRCGELLGIVDLNGGKWRQMEVKLRQMEVKWRQMEANGGQMEANAGKMEANGG
jgi:hypothetical protein